MQTDPAEAPPKVSSTWTHRFLQRYPKYHVRKQKTLDVERKTSHDAGELGNWFERYKVLVEEKVIQRADIHNFDKTGFQIGISDDEGVVTREVKRPLTLASSSNCELVIVIEMISGDRVFCHL